MRNVWPDGSRGRVLLLTVLAVTLGSCGGGSGGDDPLAPADMVDLAQVQALWNIDTAGVGGDGDGDGGTAGAAGEGSAKRRAVVVLTDANGKTLSGMTDDKGNYLIKFKTATMQSPYVVKVIDAAGNVLSSATEQAVPAGKVARVNITPLTDKVTSDSLVAGVSGTDKTFTGAGVDVARLATAKADLTASVRDALSAAGVADSSKFDPVRSIFSQNGTGVDAVIESISHSRDPGTGATQLRAKLAPVTTNADGSIVLALITSVSPLPITLVALPTNPSLTFTKLTAWMDRINKCLAISPAQTAECNDVAFEKMVSAAYKHNSRDFDEDFRTLCSESDRSCVGGSEFRNPNLLFITRSEGGNVDDVAVVEVTIRQPRTGPLAGNSNVPIEYTKVLIFKRDDTTTGLVAGNWILHGNQRSFNWSIEPQFFTVVGANPNSTAKFVNQTYSALRMSFAQTIFDPVTRTNVASKVYAVRLKGPGLPAGGVVFVPSTANVGGNLTILNKTGVIPAEGTKSGRPQSDFRIAGAIYPNGAAIDSSAWSGNPTGNNSPVYADTSNFSDYSKLQAYSLYSAEIYTNGNTNPIVETSRILAPIEAPMLYVKRPLHDLSPSLDQVTPPAPATSSIIVKWQRNPLAVRIESAYTQSFVSGISLNNSASLADAFQLNPTSTSVTIPIAQGTIPAFTTNVGDFREVGLFGRAGRAAFSQSILWAN